MSNPLIRAALVWLAAMVPAITPVDAETLQVNTRIEAVQLFPSGARVTRVGTAQIPAGTHQLNFPGMPTNLNFDETLLELDPAELVVGAMDIEWQRPSNTSEAEELRSQMEVVNGKIRVIDDEIAVANLQLKYLSALAEGPGDGENATPPSLTVLELIGDGGRQVRDRLRDAQQRKKELQSELVQLRNSPTARRRGRGPAMVTAGITSEAAQSVTFRLTYPVRDANWEYRYEVQFNSNANVVTFNQVAVVTQDSNETWEDVRISLSTFQPDEHGDISLPEYEPEFLILTDAGQISPEQKTRYGERVNRTEYQVAQNDGAIEEIMVSATKRTRANISANAYAATYELENPFSLPNDDSERELLLGGRQIPSNALSTKVRPTEDPTAFLYASITHLEEQALPPGELLVYRDGAAIGRADLPGFFKGDKMSVPLGPDNNMTVVIKDDGGQEASRGIFGRSRMEATRELFEIRSLHKTAQPLEVQAAMPVARDAAIKVTIPKSATKASEISPEGRPGLVFWRQDIAPGGELVIRHHYDVTYPADEELDTDY